MRLVFLGSGAFAEPTMNWLANSDHEVAMVITQPARKAGRGRKTTPTPVAQLAAERGWEIIETDDVNSPPIIQKLKSLDVTLGLVIAFGQKLGPELLKLWPGGFINLHASLLPKYRGAAPINWAIVRGEERTGCSVFKIVSRMDAGPMLSSRWTQIKPEETAGELHDRLAGIGVDAVDAALQLYLNGQLPAGEPQNDREATLAPKLFKANGEIDFGRTAQEVTNHICGMTPWPGAMTKYDSPSGRWEKVTILRARPAEVVSDEPQKMEPGTIDERRFVVVSGGLIEILEIKPTSGRTMSWREYVNGRHVQVGDRFTAIK